MSQQQQQQQQQQQGAELPPAVLEQLASLLGPEFAARAASAAREQGQAQPGRQPAGSQGAASPTPLPAQERARLDSVLRTLADAATAPDAAALAGAQIFLLGPAMQTLDELSWSPATVAFHGPALAAAVADALARGLELLLEPSVVADVQASLAAAERRAASGAAAPPSPLAGLDAPVGLLSTVQGLCSLMDSLCSLVGRPDWRPAPNLSGDEAEAEAALTLLASINADRLLPLLARGAAVVTAQLRRADPCSREAGVWMLPGTGLLQGWHALAACDPTEEGLAVLPPLLSVLPDVAALAHTVLAGVPRDFSTLPLSEQAHMWQIAVGQCMMVATQLAGSMHMQFCKVMCFAGSLPECNMDRATAHMLARNADVQAVLLAFFAVKVAAVHLSNKGGTQPTVPSLQNMVPLPGLALMPAVRTTPAPRYDLQLLEALGMPGLAASGLVGELVDERRVGSVRGLARIALWAVEHQLLQRGVPGGAVGVPAGAHGAVLACAAEYAAVMGPEAVQLFVALRFASLVVADRAAKAGAGGSGTAPGGSGASDLELGLASLLQVLVPACVAGAETKVVSRIADAMETFLMQVASMSDEAWRCHLLGSCWTLLSSLLAEQASAGPLAAALWQEPAVAAASLEWLARCGPLQEPAQQQLVLQQQGRTLIRVVRRIAAALTTQPPPPARAAAGEGALASLLVSWLKRLKLRTQQPGCPPATWRAVAELASAAAAVGRASSAHRSSSDGGGRRSRGRQPSKSGGAAAIAAAHALWWLGGAGRWPAALEGDSSDPAAVAEQLAAALEQAADCVAWLAAELPALPAPAGLLAGPGAAAWQRLPEQASEVAAALRAVLPGDGTPAAAASADALRSAVAPACARLAAFAGALAALLPSQAVCNNLGCCRLAAASETEAARARQTRCSSCHAARFDCRQCLREAWPAHKQTCTWLATAAAAANSGGS